LRKSVFFWLLAGLSLLCPGLAQALYGEPYASDGDLTSNLRRTIDLSSRAILATDTGEWSAVHAIGLDLHKVFTGPGGDWGTLLLQPYWVKLKDIERPPYGFNGPNDDKLTWRMTNFNYTGLARGRFNVRAGHFEVPYGLEQNVDTNGTLRQYTFPDRGIKVDWGATINGVLPRIEYEIALSRGSGIDYSDRDNPWLLSGRVGTSSSGSVVAGLSFLRGDILGPGGATRRNRLGMDLTWYTGPYDLMFELSWGNNEGDDRLNGLGEVSFRSPMQVLHVYVQVRYTSQDTQDGWDDESSVALGVGWQVRRQLELTAQLVEALDTMSDKPDTGNLAAQVRFRF
jgi:hypothetical protein